MSNQETGVWIVGARGFIATTTILGKFLLDTQKIEPIGMLTYSEHLQHLPLINWQQIQFGGGDIHYHSLTETLERLVEDNIVPLKLASESAKYLKDVDPSIENVLESLPPGINLPPNERIQVIRGCLSRFKEKQNLERIIVIDLSSTQPVSDVEDKLFSCENWDSLHEFLKLSSEPIPWSVIYSTAALLENCAYINFTPNIGSELPGLQDLAQQKQLPHAGKDGKTGETLLKTVLAPMFLYRQMKVLAWQSYNMLGNSDGATLANPNSKKAKIRSKDSSLRKILTNSPDVHSHVAIDYVPSLGDWKTAMNFVHFQGFMNVPMSLQFTWSGCDTILAVPLVLDLIRLVELAWRKGEYGKLDYLSAYFKSPIDYPEGDFREQIRTLLTHFSASSDK